MSLQPEENGNGTPNGLDNETSFSRGGSPSQDEKNGNLPDENGELAVTFQTLSLRPLGNEGISLASGRY